MTHNQFETLLAYIDARIDEKIGEAFGRDTLYESVRADKLRSELVEVLVNESIPRLIED